MVYVLLLVKNSKYIYYNILKNIFYLIYIKNLFKNREYIHVPTKTCYPCNTTSCKKCVDYSDKCTECNDPAD